MRAAARSTLLRRSPVLAASIRLGAAMVLIWTLAPFLWALLTSFTPENEITGEARLPSRLSFDNYVYAWRATPLPLYFLNTLIVAGLTTALSIACSISAAYAFSRYRFAGRGALILGLLVIYLFPATLLVIPLFPIMRTLGLLDSYLGLVLAHATHAVPFCVWMLTGYFDAIPRDLEEAAELDGATPFGAFRRVTLPLAMPGVAATAIFAFLYSWQEYLFVLFFTTGEAVRTLPVGLQVFLSGELDVRWGAINAQSVITTVPVVALFMLLQRHFVRGLTSGALKG